ncbi:MAG: EAL and HDOD domain-containing protein [Methylophilaceae bacterium]
MSEIIKFARTTLLILNERGLAPTPDNYAKIYCEVSGDEYVPFTKVEAAAAQPAKSAENKVARPVVAKLTESKLADIKRTQSFGGTSRKDALNPESFFLGRRPILHASQLIAGYDLSLYAYGQKVPRDFSVSEMAKVLADIGADGVLQGHFGLIPITLDELMDNQLAMLSGAHMVLELADAELDELHIAKIIDLKTRGFKFALADYFEHPADDVVLKLMDYVKLDIQANSQYEMSEALKRLKKTDRGSPIAINVETPKLFEQSRELAIGLVEGFFFDHPDAAEGGTANSDQAMLLVVMGQLLTDVELPRIEKAFHGHTALITNLLSMVNSAGMGLARTVDSLQQALVILGRRHLMRWVEVLLYSNSDLKGAKMLMQMAATRAKLMDLLCTTHKDVEKRQETFKDSAFTVGILSLTDVLLGMDLTEILDQIGLSDEIKQALLAKEGFLGNLLLLTDRLEKAEYEAVEILLDELDIAPKDLRHAQKETLRWVNNLGKSSDE